MTKRKHFKQLVRGRMEKTGESYSSARRHILTDIEPPAKGPQHFPGNIPATTALRVVLTAVGVRDPHTGKPLGEAMLFGLAGGVGIGVFSFFYEKEGFASLFLGGRHCWHDNLGYLSRACERLGATVQIREATSAKAADKALREALADGPCVAWVDMAHLPHRGLPAQYSGGGYHVVSVYEIDDDGTVRIGDLTDEPVSVAGPQFAEARGRIKKDKNRLLSITAAEPVDLAAAVRDALRACHAGLAGEGGVKSAKGNFSLEALSKWAERLHGSKDKERWERVFAPPRLWRGLLSVDLFVEHWGTGGGLCRPLFAEFLDEAAGALKDARLRGLASRYAELGRDWSELAAAALPANVPEFREARELHARVGELTHSGGSPDEIRAAFARLDALEKQAADRFPLSEADCAALRADLQRRVRVLHEGEVAARSAIGDYLG